MLGIESPLLTQSQNVILVSNLCQFLYNNQKIESMAAAPNSNLQVTKARPDEPEMDQPPSAGVVPKLHFRWLMTGPSRSGKSNLARWVLDNHYKHATDPKKSFFDRVVLLSPTAKIDWNWGNMAGLKEKDRIENPTPKFLADLLRKQRRKIQGDGRMKSDADLERMAKRRKTSDKVLIILDDAIADGKLMHSDEFDKIHIQGRHYGISTMMMTQSYMKVPRTARLQATHVSMFPSKASEIERLYDEHGPKELSKKEFGTMVREATTPEHDEDYPFLHVDVNARAGLKFRKNLTHTMTMRHQEGAQRKGRKGKGRKRKAEYREKEEGALPQRRGDPQLAGPPAGQKVKRRR
jgi:hypothetical protein